jgi:hypothetical protein
LKKESVSTDLHDMRSGFIRDGTGSNQDYSIKQDKSTEKSSNAITLTKAFRWCWNEGMTGVLLLKDGYQNSLCLPGNPKISFKACCNYKKLTDIPGISNNIT